jgi:hypothetical protein
MGVMGFGFDIADANTSTGTASVKKPVTVIDPNAATGAASVRKPVRVASVQGSISGTVVEKSEDQPAAIPTISASGATQTSTVSDPKLLKELETLSTGLAIAAKTPKDTIENTQWAPINCSQFLSVITHIAGRGVRTVEERAAVNKVSSQFIELSSKEKAYYMGRLEVLKKEPTSDANEKEINDIKKALDSISQAEQFLLSNRQALGLSNETIGKLMLAIHETGDVAEKIIEVAIAKNYKINSPDSTLKELEDGHDTMFEVTGLDEEKTLNALKNDFNKLIQTILNDIKNNNLEQKELDDAAYKKISSERRRELATIEKKYFQKLTDSRLKQKLKAIIIHLGFIIKYPSSLTSQRVETFRDEVNKIKWQTMQRH